MHVRGVYVGVDIAGPAGPTAPAVVLMHAFPLSKRMWARNVPPLAAAGWRVVTLDFRGFGLSEAPDGPYPMAMLAEDVIAVVDQLRIGRAVFAGLSMGGYVLFEVLRQAADVVRAAAFCDTRADADTAPAREARHKAVEEIRTGRAGREDYLAGLIGKLLGPTTLRERPAVVAEVQAMTGSTPDAGLIGALLGMASRADNTPTLAVLRDERIPTLFLAGEEDGITTLEMARAMAAAVPGSRLVAVPAAGHLTNLEAPAAFDAALGSFLASLPAESGS